MNITPEDAKVYDYMNKSIGKSEDHTKKYLDNLDTLQDTMNTTLSQKSDKINQHLNEFKLMVENSSKYPNQIKNQSKIIKVKTDLINTRLTMLDNARRKNSTRKKLIYSSIAMILLIILIIVSIYVYKNKKYHVRNFNKNVATK